MDELLATVWKEPSYFFAHPRAIAGRIPFFGSSAPGWYLFLSAYLMLLGRFHLAHSGACRPSAPSPKPTPIAPEELCQRGDILACIAAARAMESKNRLGALDLLQRACDQTADVSRQRVHIAQACTEAVRLCEVMGLNNRATALRKRAAKISEPAPVSPLQ